MESSPQNTIETINIVSIIENNPVSFLSNDYNNKLLDKIQTQFTEDQQKLFIASFYCFLKYHPTNDFVVSLDNIWEWLGFSQKVSAKKVLTKNFIVEKDYKISLYKLVKQDINGENHGGQNKETFLLNVKTFKLLCLKANTRKSNEIHNYFVSLELLVQETIKGQCEDIQKQFENSKIENEKLLEIQQTTNYKFHKKLIQIHNKKNVVYIARLNEENKKWVIKIGSTQNIKERMANLKTSYGLMPNLLEVFECVNHVQFENWIKNNPSIKHLYHPISQTNGKLTTETFIVNENEYESIVATIKNELENIVLGSHPVDLEKQIENEKMKKETAEVKLKNTETELKKAELELKKTEAELELKKFEFEIKKLETEIKINENVNKNNQIYLQISDPPTPAPPQDTEEETANIPDAKNPTPPAKKEREAPIYVKQRYNSRSPKVYQYDPITFECVKIHDSIIDAIRSFDEPVGLTSIKTASKNNTIYKNYRWMMADRNITEIPVITQETKEIRKQPIEYIAMINIKKTKIMEVYSSQKEAAQSRNLAGFSTISRAIKTGGISSGHYWNVFHQCSKEMQDEYLKTNVLPERHIATTGINVIQIDPITDNEIKIFHSMMDVVKIFQMSRTSLKRVANTNNVHKGFKWKIVEKY